MDCDRAADLLSARLDGEVVGEAAAAALDAHLAGCAGCQTAAAETELQDAALRRAFAGRRAVAAAVAERVTAATAAAAPGSGRDAGAARPAGRRLGRWAGWVAAAAAGFAAAALLYRPPARSGGPGGRPAGPGGAGPVATLALATGDVFACPSGGGEWRPIGPGGGVPAGARVRTAGAAKCELRLSDGSVVRLNAGTEARFAAARAVEVAGGQVWSAVPGGSAPLRVSAAGGTSVTAGGPGAPSDGAAAGFDVACAPGRGATVTVVSGSAGVSGGAGRGGGTVVQAGQALDLPPRPSSAADFTCTPVADPTRATRWQDELLVLKPGDDPEVVARAGQLLARVVAERAGGGGGPTGLNPPGPAEADVRGRGADWAGPLARYASGPAAAADPAARRVAAWLLADLATPARVPDLIGLLDDAEGPVRFHAATALRRLTGLTLGHPPERCLVARDPAAAAAWRAWWERAGKR